MNKTGKPWEDEPDAWRGSVKEATWMTYPAPFRWFAPFVGWYYEAVPPALRPYRKLVNIVVFLEFADVLLHAYEVFYKA